MENAEIRSERKRGRKRKRIDVQNVEVDDDGKKRMVGRGKALVARYVRKEFEGSGLFLGKIVSYDSGLYRVDYEDGDCEDLESSEVKEFLIQESDLNGEWLERKKKLDAFVSSKGVKLENNLEVEEKIPVESSEAVSDHTVKLEVGNLAPEELTKGFTDDWAEVSAVSEVSNPGCELSCAVANHDAVGVQVSSDENSDSLTDSYEDDVEQDHGLEVEVPNVPRPELPPSSRNIGIPEEHVSHLLSVYSFLRSFSIQLFLSPFKLDDFVGSLNCAVPNTLLDSIHVALMRALRRHFEKLSSDGSERASKCLRAVDWSLLDALTWPVYVVHYLLVMGYTYGPEWKGFYTHALKKDYYTLSVGKKLAVLQILCDDVLDTEELRAEIDMREELEVGIDSETGIVVAPANGPRRVHPRNSKTSACKDQEVREFIGQNQEMKSYHSSSQLISKDHGQDASSEVDQDSNGDECRLCGMDGTLLCCDGCPASYHSRCIGVSKMFVPDGPWYCPECTIKKSGPRIASQTTLTGADIFGIDVYEQVFVGACDHLLVLNASMGSDSCLRYYNQNDIPVVIQALQLNEQHISMYSEICKGIIQYWGIPADIISFSGKSVDGKQKEDAKSTFLGTEGHVISEMTENEDTLSGVSGSSLRAVMPNNAGSFNTMINLDHAGEHGTEGNAEEQAGSLVKAMVPGDIQVKSTTFSGPISECTDPLVLQQKNKSTTAISTFTPRNMVGSLKEHVGAPVVTKLIIRHGETRIGIGDGDDSNSVNGFLYMGSSFKSHGYINNYLHGDFAASAAANLAVLSSEENQVLESHVSDRRRFISANFSLQVKAFSSAAMRFFWPHMEKKLIEVPRERCSWCLSCKAPVVSKRGCLLNAAASNAIKGAMKILVGLRPPKNGEGTLPGIATYIMFMEESLSGLIIGPFQTAAFRRQWRGQVEQANSLSALKILLLELEENIRPIALSGDWVKLVDGWSAESSIIQNATAAVGSTQKRKPGRRGRKPSIITEVNADDAQDTLTDFTWWRGNMLSVLLFQKGSLPLSLTKKAARQGGSKKIPGIYYPEGSETSKRSRRLVWRTAVEMSRNASQLALQVRYLDLYVRWNDLVRPELSVQDAKSPESEASAFRNAYICDKKIVENEIRYGVAFRSQKHLPSRVMKTIIEVEQNQNGKEKYWFPETRIPLYLIKEYEEHCMKDRFASANMPVNALAKSQSRCLKVSSKDVFLYLVRKRDKFEKHDCSVCKLEVLQGDAVKCSACEGFCHEQCTFSSMVQISNEVEFSITCKQCYQSKLVSQSSYESPTSPLLLQGQEFPNDTMVNHAEKLTPGNQSSPSADASQQPSNYMKPITASKSADKSKRKLASWGLIWKKKNCEDTGIDFRLKNILLKGNQDMDWSIAVCHLCRKPYNPNLMYIRCQHCTNWYHAEAVELEESKIFELVGFKCCRCRRIRSPVCPYSDKSDAANKKQLEVKKIRIKPPKRESQEKNPELVVSQHVDVDHANTILQKREEVASVAADEPLIFMHSSVDQHANANSEWNTGMLSGFGPQKLPVRRHNKRGTDADLHSIASESSHIEVSTSGGGTLNPAEESLLPPVEWGVSSKGLDEGVMFDYEGLNYEDMEFEPQTYFSFNELLASDDGGPLAGTESSGNVAETWDNFCLFPSDEVSHASADQQEPMISTEHVNMVPCKMCSHTEPYPDLSCQICGLQIHSHCSPWDEQSFKDDCWRCGNCRDWR